MMCLGELRRNGTSRLGGAGNSGSGEPRWNSGGLRRVWMTEETYEFHDEFPQKRSKMMFEDVRIQTKVSRVLKQCEPAQIKSSEMRFSLVLARE